MLVRLTDAYRRRIADALTGQGSAGLVLSRAAIGNGSGANPPKESMYAQTTTPASLSIQRMPNHEVKITVLLPAGQDLLMDEIGIFGADDTLLLHCTFDNQPLISGSQAQFEFTFNPEVYNDAYQG